MNQEEEKEGTANNPLPTTGSDNSDSPSYSYLSAASLSPIPEASLDSSTPPREDPSLLTPLRQSTTSPRSAKPLKRKQQYLSTRGEAEPEAKLDHNNSALSGSSSGDSTDSAIPSLDSYLAGHQIKSIVSKETTNDPEESIERNDDNDKGTSPPDPSDPQDPSDPPDDPSKTTMPSTRTTPTVATTAIVQKDLEHLLVDIMALKLTDYVSLALHRQGCRSFEDFCVLDEIDTDTLQYDTVDGISNTIKAEPCNSTDRKKIKRAVAYCAFRESDGSDVERRNPTAWVAADYSTWCRTGYPAWLITLSNAASVTSSSGTSGSSAGTIFLPKSQLEKDQDALLVSWNRSPRDIAKYPHIKDDVGYGEWFIKMKRQLKADRLWRVAAPNWTIAKNCSTGSDTILAELQLNYFEQILAAVLQNPEGKGLLTTHPEDSLYVWKKHEEHQTSSDSAMQGTHILMNKIMSLTITKFDTRYEFLISFQECADKYDKIARKPLDEEFKIMLLQKATNPDVALSNSWVQKTEAKRANALPGAPTAVSYTEYLKFLMQQSKVHDLNTPFKRPTRHAHQAESFYNDNDNGVIDGEDDGTSDFIANMSISGETMSNEQTVLAFAAYQRNRPPPRPRDPEADIDQAIYSKCSREFRIAWSKEPTDIKKQILKQNNNKSPKQGAKKNSELAVYMGQSEGYETDTSAYSEATYGYDADDNDDQSVIEATELVANAARRRPNGILKKKDLPKKTDLPIADPRRMLSNRSTPLIGKDGNITGHLTYTASMAVIRHRFDQVDSSQAVSIEDNYVISVNATKFFDEPLALMDGGANGGIAGSDMRVMSYNSDGRRVNIGIAGDHQMTGKKLGTFCAVIETRFGRVLAIFHQYAHVPEQRRSIHSKCQFQAHHNLVGDTATAYGGLQRIDTADGYQLPLTIRAGLPYIRQTYPTDADMNLPQVQFTSPSQWDPNLNDDNRTSEEMIRTFPPIPKEAIDNFYDEYGRTNYDYLQKRVNKTVEIEPDDDDSVGTMPGLQDRAREDSSSDDDSVVEHIKPSTSIEWNVPIDDSNGEKIECPRLRKSKLKRRIRIKEKRLKAASSKQELTDKKTSASKANDLPIPIIDNMGNNEESSTMVDGIKFFPAERNSTCTDIIEDNNIEDLNDQIFYDSTEVLHDPNIFVDTVSDTAYLDDMSTPRPTEHEYWEDFLSNEVTQRLIYQGIIDSCEQYDINANDIASVMTPLKPRYSVPTPIDYESKRKYFAHLPADIIRNTFKNTTQNMKLPPSTNLHKMFKSPNPSANLKRRDEADATDMIYSNTPAINGGEKCAHIFVGKKSKLTDAYKVKNGSSEEFLESLQDRVRYRGCPTGLEADNAPMYRGWKNSRYLRDICISQWQCESKYQHQNYAENRWQTVKRYTNRVMDRSGCPPYIWFLALSYVIFCLNHCVDPMLGDGTKSPLQIATFQMTDISPLLYFYFWEPVYFLLDEKERKFPGKSKECRGHWVGVSEHIGNKMTYKIITDDTGEEICRSAIRTARDTTMKNLREDPITIDDNLLNVEDIISPAEEIANIKLKEVTSGNTFNNFDTTAILKNIDDQLQEELKVKAKAKAHQLQEEADDYFFDSNEQQTGHFNTAPPVVPVKSSLPKRSSTTKSKHVKPKKLRDLHPKDPSRGKGTRSSKRLRDMNIHAMNALMTNEVQPEQDLPLSTSRQQEHVTDINHPTNPRPSPLTRQQVLKNRDTHITEQEDQFVYLRENGENENPIWQEFEFPLEDENGNAVIGEDGKPMVIIAPPPSDLVGRVFLTKPDERGEVNRARVVELIKNFDGEVEKNQDLIRFKLNYDHSSQEDIMSYNEILDYIEREENNEDGHHWKFRTILGHVHTPVGHKERMGSDYNVKTAWETGAVSVEPLDFLAKDIPVDLAIYAKKHDLLELEGWKRFKRIANRDQHIRRLVKQAKLRSFRVTPKYKYGFSIPRNYKEALEFDERNGNHKWQEANVLEHAQLTDYAVFKNKGKFNEAKIPEGYRKIQVHTIFDVKHDGRHKARVVANGNLTDVPLESVYSGVVSLRGLRTCIFLGELNNMTPWATDIGNAYLEAKTTEKVCIKAGPEFGELQGNLLIIDKALYGLRLSGKAFNILLSDCLRDLGFFPSKAESSIFMRKCPTRDVYEYVATYVDDLCIIMENPLEFLEQLSSAPYNFKLKGSGEVNFHLGCGFERDSDGVLCMNPGRYVDKMEDAYKQVFKELPKQKYRSPLVKGDHPELDTTAFLDQDGIEIYQSLIGAMQWAISIGRWDIQSAVMTLSSFRAQPRKGHLERIKRIYGFLCKFRHFKLRFRVDEPDYSGTPPMPPYDWSHSVYGNPTEDIPKDAPPPLGKRIVLTHYFDANLMHDVLSGKAVTGVVHFYNKTPVDWYSKKQSTTETATYGSEFLACRTCFEQIIDHRQYLRYLGVPVGEEDYAWGDNDAMINSATIPDAKLHKRHNILSFHFVRSLIASGFINLQHIKSESNIADILTKHWGYQSTYELIRPIFHFGGNTAALYFDDTLEVDRYITQSELDEIVTINGEC